MDYKNTNHINLDTKPVDNKTYIKCHDNKEKNDDERLKYFASLWKTTNFFLAIIGIYFFGKIVIAIMKVIFAIQLSKNMAEIFTATFF